MSKTNATHIQKHPRFFWEFLEHFKFFDFDQAITRKNNYSETPKAPRLTQNWLSSTKLAITSEILGILSPKFLHLYLQKPTLPPCFFWRSKLNRLKLEQLTGSTFQAVCPDLGYWVMSFHSFLLPPFSHSPTLLGLRWSSE